MRNKKKTLDDIYNTWQNIINLFFFTTIGSEARYKSIKESKSKNKNIKSQINASPIALVQIKAGNTKSKLLNKIRQIVYSLYWEQKCSKKVYNNLIQSMHI